MDDMQQKTGKPKLTTSQDAHVQFVRKRIRQLQESRRDHYGRDLDALWAEADRDYVPHRLRSKGKRVLATDEEKGWRGTLVKLEGSGDWQSDVSQANPYVKIQTALSILVDQNPTGVFTATTSRYQKTTELIKQLYYRSWEYARSREQLRLFVFNVAKYGWAIGRTYPLRITRNVNVLQEYNAENPDESTWKEKEVVEYNDIYRENLDPHNAWIDDMARPSNAMSLRDWCWRKVYDYDVAADEFGKYKNWKYVQTGGDTEEVIAEQLRGSKKKYETEHLVEVYFYENRIKDLFVVLANGIPIIIEPLPVSDASGLKKLSCWQTYWNIRHTESPYGIGIFEAIRFDQALLDRIRNMTIDQLTLSIYKMFFYQGTQALTETGDISIAPGIGKQVLDPKNINWLEIPGPGAQAFTGIELFRKDVDEASGITDPLIGQITGKTAFEIAQAKEAALKRLKNPLENILEALNQEGYITVSLIQLLYSIPETYKIVDSRLIEDYLREIEGDPDLYKRGEDGVFNAVLYREFPLNLERDEKGILQETKDSRFFRVKPKLLSWEGMITIKAQSILTPSKQVDKALELEMYNILIPLLANPPELFSKIAKSIVKLYDKDPRDVLPDAWLQEQVSQGEPLTMPIGGLIRPQTEAPKAERFIPSVNPPEQPQGIAGRISARISEPFR